ncbi:MAG: hypothetical protein WD492_06220 [Alkalispirochaeta sp.]
MVITTPEDHRPPRVYQLPPGRIVRRARQWWLYDQAGDRYIDFWQADGGAFLGHRPRGLGRLVEAEIDRGLWAPVPTAWPGRLERALARLAAVAELPSLTPINGRPQAAQLDSARWLPLSGPSDLPAAEEAPTVVVPVPGATLGSTLEFSEISPTIVAALTRMTLALVDYLSDEAARQRVARAEEPAIPPGYRRSGVWMVPVEESPRPDWGAWRTAAAERGILLPPDGATPLSVPGELTRRDLDRWKGLVHDWPR